ncbi:MAG: gamma-glutamyltransferase [Rhodobacteraceae bacterium]|nr:gamma-glutamyltransferase [Paracoccaceae bacterium]
MKPPLPMILALAATLAPPALAQEPPAQPESTTAIAERASVEAGEFMVAAAHPLAAKAGYDVLAAGGSAADAAIAVQVMLGLVEPQSSGLGGGAFLLYWDASEGALTSFDARETAPASAGPDYWLTPDGAATGFWEAVVGGRSVGVPGVPMLLETLHARHGRLPWAGLFQPTIDLAEAGFPVSPRLAAAIVENEPRSLDAFPETRAYFFAEDGAPLAAGALRDTPDFARTLRLIAAEGARPFYEGAIAGDIVAAVRTEANPGELTLADLAAYRVVERAPVCLDYRAWEVCGMGPPSSGGLTVGQILGMLSSFDLGAPGSNLNADHLFLEATKLAFADRGLYMADADFVRMPTAGLLDPDYLASRAALIDPGRATGAATPGEPPWNEGRLYGPDQDRPEHGTSHFVIVDRHGDMVSATTSIETGFGSRVMTNGFLLNNQLTDFAFVPEAEGKPVANRVEGGKRPRSSMAPTVVFEDGAPALLIGSPGGARIIPYVARSLVGILDLGLDPQAAIDRPHLTSQGAGPGVDVEEGPGAAETIAALNALGHEAEAANLNSGLHAIEIEDGVLRGAADKRREGLVLGE